MQQTDCYLFRQEHIPERAVVPVIDAHNHLWGSWAELDQIVAIMQDVGVVSYCDLTANVSVSFGEGGYILGTGSFETFVREVIQGWPGRFYGFTTATFSRPVSEPLFADVGDFVRETLDSLRRDVALGARGLKILKELGLHYRDGQGKLVEIDDPGFDPVWDEAGRLGVPVLMHQSDPYGFFLPATPENEHCDSLRKFPSWNFADPQFPRKRTLLERRDRVLRRHPNTTFMLPHVANFPENLGYVAELLEQCPNVFIDISARIDELGRQPYSSREFMIHFQDRVLFGTDMPASSAMYRCYFRFLETYDEYFFPPDYDGTFSRRRWPICGLGLPKHVLEKIYFQNALRIVPGLCEEHGVDRKHNGRCEERV